MAIDLYWLNSIGWPHQTKLKSAVLTKYELAGLLTEMDSVTALLV